MMDRSLNRGMVGWKSLAYLALTFLILPSDRALAAQADCDVTLDMLKPADFKSSLVVNGERDRTTAGQPETNLMPIEKPTQIGFIPGNSRYVFFNEIYKGTIKKWDTETKTLSTLIDMPLNTTGERGLTGFVFHPDFARNHWVFVVYNDSNKIMKLARFEYDLTADKLINPKILIQHALKTNLHHYGNGQLAIDDQGVLFLGIGSDADYAGDNLYGNDLPMNGEATAGNTNTISSSIIRIVPDSTDKGYRVPAGNFGEYFEKYFRNLGNTAVADEYKTKVKPEIYIKGIRTDYTVTVHPKKGWLAWGEVNTSNRWDEYDIVNTPMFSGYPYFHGKSEPLGGVNPNIKADPTKPVPNKSKYNTGVSLLPPPQGQSLPPIKVGIATSATVGSIYDFNSHAGANRFPKAFDQNLLMFDFQLQDLHMYLSSLKESGEKIIAGPQINVARLLDNVFMKFTLDAEFSPDGELFLLNVGTDQYDKCGGQCGSIDKVIYTGGQCPQTVSLAETRPETFYTRSASGLLSKSSLPLQVGVYDLKGRILLTRTLNPGAAMDIRGVLDAAGKSTETSAVYIVNLSKPGVSWTEKFMLTTNPRRL